MATSITTDEVRAWSSIVASDPGTNDALIEVVAATNALVARRCLDFVNGVWPDEVHTAALIQAARLFKRRGSPEGVAGFGDFGLVRVTRWDDDIESHLAPYLRVAFA